MNKAALFALSVACMLVTLPLAAQDAGGPPAAGRGGRGGGAGGGRGAPAYPPRITESTIVERGKAAYTDNGCAGCHADDTRGTNRGPSLLRSQLVQRDQKGELITPIIHTGSVGMPASPTLTEAQIADIAEFLHSIPINSRDPARQRPETIVIGNAVAGQIYFQANCSACHSVAGDLKGLATKYDDPRILQGRYLSPTPTQPVMVTVTQANGTRVTGKLARIDEFLVSLTMDDGSQRTISRKGNVPKIEIRDPLQGHRDLLKKYADQNIHDLTAYLVTLK
jgi:mono/diheme cytochrome c family protein